MRRPPSSTLFPYTTPSHSAEIPNRELAQRPRRRPRLRREKRRPRAQSRLVPEPALELELLAHVERAPGHEFRARGAQERSRSEEHTSELQSRQYIVCRLLL